MISLLFTLVVIGAILFILDRVIPMDAGIKTVIRVVVILAVLYYVLVFFGLIAGHVPRLG